MRVLLITETVPYPADSGGRIKTWHTLRNLSSVHEVHCHAFVRSEAQRDAAIAPLREVCRSVTLHVLARTGLREARYLTRSLARGVPYTVARHFSGAAYRSMAIANREHEIDIVYCDHLSMLEYGRRLGAPIVHDAHNVEHRIAKRYARGFRRADPRRLLFEREWRLLARYEAVMYPRCALVLAVSDGDRRAIEELARGRVPVVPVPIGLDVRSLAPPVPLTERPEVLFVGGLDWPPNGEAVEILVREIWPRVLAEVPGARLTVVGRGERRFVREAAVEGVRFTGWVQDVEPYFLASRVVVVPLRSGSGMRVKILDALARGIPVVSTSVGAEGIEVVDGHHAAIADTPEAFAAATIRILRDSAWAHRLSRNGRALAEARYDVSVIARQQLEAIRRFER